jgi:lysophospholipid acyltransferase (LPLAT)-like uncharacterized protein
LFRTFILPRLIYWFYRLWVATWRFHLNDSEEVRSRLAAGDHIIFAHWHRDELTVLHLVKPYHIATMTSKSRDGQLIDYVIKRFGGATSKGSSSRGGAGALKGLNLLVQSGFNASMAVDGPKGPIYRPKAGVFELSKLSGAWICPLGAASSNRFTFEKSWNKARLPKPFSKVVVTFGPLLKTKDLDSRDPELAQTLAAGIDQSCRSSELLLNPQR